MRLIVTKTVVFILPVLFFYFLKSARGQTNSKDTLSTGLLSDCDSIAYRYINPGAPPLNDITLKHPLKKADLSKYLPFVEDQGYKGACTAFSVASALTILQNRRNHKTFLVKNRQEEKFFLSPAFIFNLAKAKYPGPASNDCRTGISYIDAFLIVKDFGEVSWHSFPYKLMDNNQCTGKVSNDIKTNAGSSRILTFQKPTISVEIFKAFLCDTNLEYPINISVNIDRNYWDAGQNLSAQGNGRWVAKGSNLHQKAQHAMCIVGYNDDKHAFKVLDSRGAKWGDEGFIWMDYNLIENPSVVYDAFVCSFDNRLLSHTSQESAGGHDITTISAKDSSFVEAGYFQNYGNYRVACADISYKRKTADILIRDSDGNPLTPITTVSLSNNISEVTEFNLGGEAIRFRIYSLERKSIFSSPSIHFEVSLRSLN